MRARRASCSMRSRSGVVPSSTVSRQASRRLLLRPAPFAPGGRGAPRPPATGSRPRDRARRRSPTAPPPRPTVRVGFVQSGPLRHARRDEAYVRGGHRPPCSTSAPSSRIGLLHEAVGDTAGLVDVDAATAGLRFRELSASAPHGEREHLGSERLHHRFPRRAPAPARPSCRRRRGGPRAAPARPPACGMRLGAGRR